jgi:hypothetical protein
VPAVITVTTMSDAVASDGQVSLREAINSINAGHNTSDVVAVGTYGVNDTIDFDIPGGGSILASSGYTLSKPVTIDGYSNPGAKTNTEALGSGSDATLPIAVDGAIAGGYGFDITAPNCTIRGLEIINWQLDGILINGSNATIAGDFIGADSTTGCGLQGIDVAAPNAKIGSGSAADANVIAGNHQGGIQLESTASGTSIIGNIIGLEPGGGVNAGNGDDGVFLDKVTNVSLQANVISSSGDAGIGADGASMVSILGNKIGTDSSGTLARANGAAGIDLSDCQQVTIGGTGTGDGNVISGNAGNGISLGGSSATTVVIQGNDIGTGETGGYPLPNSGDGISVNATSVSNLTIGGPAAGAGNLISGNIGNGVYLFVTSGQNNIIQGNKIGTNSVGTQAVGNVEAGIEATGPVSIGGSSPGAGNLISGNYGDGLSLGATLPVLGNRIGTDASGSTALANGGTGVDIGGAGEQFGGAAPGDGNLVVTTGTEDGIDIEQAANGCSVQGNLIGTSAQGTKLLNPTASANYGIAVNSNGNTIGGTVTGAGNVIGGFNYGADLSGNNNLLLGNRIGTDQGGKLDLGNARYGVTIPGNSNSIGNATAAGANIIANNHTDGINYFGGETKTVIGINSIFNNGLGIDTTLYPAKSPILATPANLTSAVTGGGVTAVTGTLPVQNWGTGTALVYFYASPINAVGDYEGMTLLGSMKVQAGSAPTPFTFAATALPVGTRITAEVNADPTSTASASAFSSPVAVTDPTAPPPVSPPPSPSPSPSPAPSPSPSPSPSDVVITGTGGTDTLVLERTPGGSVGEVTYILNGGAPVALSGVTSFTFSEPTGNGTMTVSAVNGHPLVSGGVYFHGGTGTDTLIVDAAGAPTHAMPGSLDLGGTQPVGYDKITAIHIDNAAAVGATPGPDTADRATALFGLTPTEQYVQSLYLADLGRAGTKAELDSWLGVLAGPGGAQAVAQDIAGSTEALDHLVQGWYLSYLGRTAQNGEEDGFVTALRGGASRESVLAVILSSPEFYARAQTLIPSGTADERYVQALYQHVLGRAPSAAEVQSMVADLPTAGRTGVALGFLNSTEFRTDQVEGYYNALLHRPGDATGTSGWIHSGLDLAGILTGIQSSTEFANDA